MQHSVIIAISLLWRKLYKEYQAYPWALAPAFDPHRSDEERQAALQQFFHTNICCLDLGLSRQLRKAFPSQVDAYVGTPLGDFLKTLFERVVVTSTQVELQFSKLTALTDTRNKRTVLAGLAAKLINVEFERMVERWRDEVTTGRAHAKHKFRSRPSWTKTRNKHSHTSVFDLFKGDLNRKILESGDLGGYANRQKAFAGIVAVAHDKWLSLIHI